MCENCEDFTPLPFDPDPSLLSYDLDSLDPAHPVLWLQSELLPAVGDRVSASFLDSLRNTLRAPISRRDMGRIILYPSLTFQLANQTAHAAIERLSEAAVLAQCTSEKRGQRYLECGSNPWVYARTDADGKLSVKLNANWCKDRCCDLCQARLLACVRPRVEQIYREMTWPSFLTLTLKHEITDDLSTLLNRLQYAWTRLTKRALWRRVTGGVKFLEVKWTKNGWHPHLHCLIDCKWLPFEDLQDLWQELTGDSRLINIQRVTSSRQLASYLTKYMTKTGSFTATQEEDGETPGKLLLLAEYAVAMHNKRTMSTFGKWDHFCLTAIEESLPEYDEQDDGDWVPLGSLASLWQAADAGVTIAKRVLEEIFSQEYHDPILARRPRPPASPPQLSIPF